MHLNAICMCVCVCVCVSEEISMCVYLVPAECVWRKGQVAVRTHAYLLLLFLLLLFLLPELTRPSATPQREGRGARRVWNSKVGPGVRLVAWTSATRGRRADITPQLQLKQIQKDAPLVNSWSVCLAVGCCALLRNTSALNHIQNIAGKLHFANK